MRATHRALVVALFAGVACNAIKYDIGDTLSAEDRAVEFTACDGTTTTLGAFLDANKTIVLDKSSYI